MDEPNHLEFFLRVHTVDEPCHGPGVLCTGCIAAKEIRQLREENARLAELLGASCPDCFLNKQRIKLLEARLDASRYIVKAEGPKEDLRALTNDELIERAMKLRDE